MDSATLGSFPSANVRLCKTCHGSFSQHAKTTRRVCTRCRQGEQKRATQEKLERRKKEVAERGPDWKVCTRCQKIKKRETDFEIDASSEPTRCISCQNGDRHKRTLARARNRRSEDEARQQSTTETRQPSTTETQLWMLNILHPSMPEPHLPSVSETDQSPITETPQPSSVETFPGPLDIIDPALTRSVHPDMSNSTHPKAQTLREMLHHEHTASVDQLASEMEEAIHNHNEGYDSCLKAYEEFLRHYKRTDLQGEQRMELPNHHYIPRMATFSPGYIGNGSSTLPRGDFEISEKHHLGGCQILCATIDQLRAAKKGKGIPHAPYVLIPPDNNRPPDTSNLFRELEQSYISCDLEYQRYRRRSDNDPPTSTMPVADFLQRLNQPHGTRQLYHDGQPPLNFLNISGSVGTHISRENDVVEELDLTLLHTLTSSLRGKINANIGCGKEAIQTAALNDMKSCMSFHLVGERGTMSAWHQDIVGGTHITPVSGGKLWSIYDGPVNDEVIESFSSTAEHGGVLWKPPAGTVFTIYLAPQWTLVMNGDFTPHMATSIGGPFTHLVGGQVWSSEPEKLEPLLQKQKWLIENVNVASNEPVPRQLPDVLLELELYIIRSISEHNNLTRTYPTSLPRYTETHLQLLRSFISHIKPLLMCNCKRGSCRPPKCPCKFISSEYGDEVGGINTVKHIGGCTAFCHPDYSDPATRACKRTALAKS